MNPLIKKNTALLLAPFIILLVSWYIAVDVRLTSDFGYFYISLIDDISLHKGSFLEFLYPSIFAGTYESYLILFYIINSTLVLYFISLFLTKASDIFILIPIAISLLPLIPVPNSEIVSLVIISLFVTSHSYINYDSKYQVLLVFLIPFVRTQALFGMLPTLLSTKISRASFYLISILTIAFICFWFFSQSSKDYNLAVTNDYELKSVNYVASVVDLGTNTNEFNSCGYWNKDVLDQHLTKYGNSGSALEVLKNNFSERSLNENITFYTCKLKYYIYMPTTYGEHFGGANVCEDTALSLATGIQNRRIEEHGYLCTTKDGNIKNIGVIFFTASVFIKFLLMTPFILALKYIRKPYYVADLRIFLYGGSLMALFLFFEAQPRYLLCFVPFALAYIKSYKYRYA